MAGAPIARGRSWSMLLLLAGLSLVWGLNWPAMKLVLLDVPVLTFRAVALLAAGPVLIVMAWLGGDRIGVPRREWPMLLVSSFAYTTVWNLCTGYGLVLIPAGRAALLCYTMPLWAALFGAVVLGERLTSRGLVALVLGMGGIAVLLVPSGAMLGSAPLGAAFALAAAVGWAAGTVAMKAVVFSRSVAQLTGWQLIIGGAPIAVAALVYDPTPHLLALPGTTQAVLIYIIALPMVFGYWAWFKILDRLPGTIAGISSLAVPIIALVSSTLLLGEALGLSEITALVLVVAALALSLTAPIPPRGVVARPARSLSRS